MVEDNKNVTIIIPAFNEVENLPHTIALVHQTGFNGRILVVDDGSTDGTYIVAERLLGKENVVHMPKNVGKANAFFAGAREALRTNPEVVVTLDADMLSVPANSLFDLVMAALRENKYNKPYMVVASHIKENGSYGLMHPEVSGIRAFSSWGLRLVLAQKGLKKFVKDYQLEHFLNWFFSKLDLGMEYKRTSEPFIAEKPFRKSTNGNHQADKLGEFIVYSKPRLEQKVRQEKFFKSLRSKHPP